MPTAVRVLPVEEWGRLAGLPIAEGGLPDAAYTTILVAEATDGAIVGVWAAQTMVLLDGLWIAPPYRRRSWVLVKLLKGMRQVLIELGIVHSFAIVETTEVRTLAAKAGFTRLPGDLHLLDLSRVIPREGDARGL